jgi:aspartate aminotransferase
MTTHTDFVVSRIRQMQASPTMAVAKEAQRLRREGMDVVDFGPGEPDFDTPEHVRRAAAEALEAGMTHYSPSRGFPQLLEAIAHKLERENGISYDAATEIVVTPGAKQALVEAIFTCAGEGDEVIIFDPGWGSYDAIARLAGATPVHVQLLPSFEIDFDALAAALTSRTKVIIVGTPGNPSGAVLSHDALGTLAALCIERDLILVADEIYERITYGEACISPASIPEMRDRTVTINGFSKAYAMTGWRLGYAAAPANLMANMLKVHEHTVTSATAFAQIGAVAALEGPQEPIQAMVREFRARRDLVVGLLNALPGVTCAPPAGAFYVFPDISGTGMTGTELAHALLKVGVALTPGVGFGERWDTHVRISYATSEERIRTGLQRMETALPG